MEVWQGHITALGLMVYTAVVYAVGFVLGLLTARKEAMVAEHRPGSEPDKAPAA